MLRPVAGTTPIFGVAPNALVTPPAPEVAAEAALAIQSEAAAIATALAARPARAHRALTVQNISAAPFAENVTVLPNHGIVQDCLSRMMFY